MLKLTSTLPVKKNVFLLTTFSCLFSTDWRGWLLVCWHRLRQSHEKLSAYVGEKSQENDRNHMLHIVSWQAGAWLTSTIITTKTEKVQNRPVDDVRKDGVDHLPVWEAKQQSCALCRGPAAFSYVKCQKCNVWLYLNKDRNCFCNFHALV